MAQQAICYLDYSATCPIRPDVITHVAEVMARVGNPSSVHGAGRTARFVVEDARRDVAALVGARPRDVVFCGGGTEAANTVLRGSGAERLLISAIEHDSTRAAAAASALDVTEIPVLADGTLDLSALEALLAADPRKALVSVMAANNETGVLQPLADIGALVKEQGGLFHTDAVQAAGKISLIQSDIQADYITVSAHKLGGPQGVGAILLAPTAALQPLLVGGGQEQSRRSGTENVAGIAGFGLAARMALEEISDQKRLAGLRDALEHDIKSLAPDVEFPGAASPRLATISSILLPGLSAETQVIHMDLAGICISSGAACSSGKVRPSHVLRAMGYSEEDAGCAVRVSMGYGTTAEDIARFKAAYTDMLAKRAKKSA